MKLTLTMPTTRGDRKVELDDVEYVAKWSHERSDGITPGGTYLERVECAWDELTALAVVNQFLADSHDDEGDPPRFAGTGAEAIRLIEVALDENSDELECDE